MELNEAQAILGLEPGADRNAATAAFKIRAQMLHPDKHMSGSDDVRAEATRAMQQLNDALQVVLAHLDGLTAPGGYGTAASDEPPAPQAEQPHGKPEPPQAPGPPLQRPPGKAECVLCGATPVVRRRVDSVSSYLILLRTTSIEDRFCRDCGVSVFRDYQAKTLTRGWWSPLGALRSLWFLARNLGARRAFLDLSEPRPPKPEVVAPVPFGELRSRPVLGRPLPLLMTVVAAAIGITLIVNASSSQMGATPDTTALASQDGNGPAATTPPEVVTQPAVEPPPAASPASANIPPTAATPTEPNMSRYAVDLTNCGTNLFDPLGFVCRYVAAIDMRDWATVYYSQTAAMRAQTSEEEIAQADATTQDSNLYASVQNTTANADGAVYDVALTFTSHQDAAYGPNGDTCDIWVLTYHLVTEGPGLRLQSSRGIPGYATNTAC